MSALRLLHIEQTELAGYVETQIRHLLPLPQQCNFACIKGHLPETLLRLKRCIAEVRMWEPNVFDVLHSSQYCMFLYYLANTIWQRERDRELCTRLFLLNKALNAIDCFYEIELPEVFFIGHSVGIVLAKATYGNHLVLYQNSTIGKNHGQAPILEDGVVLYPNSAIIGRCHVARNSVIAQGVSVINQDTQADHIAYQGSAGSLVFKPNQHPTLSEFFRDM